MNKELRKETLKILRSGENIFDIYGTPGASGYENLKKALKEASKYINELQEKLEEKTAILMAGADKVKQLEKKITELEKTIDLIIDDFQAENYFINMTNKEVREYYKKRKELEE